MWLLWCFLVLCLWHPLYAQQTRLLGCFNDTKWDRDLPETFFSDTSTTRKFCLSYCTNKNFKYAATQAGKWCHCGDSYGLHGKVADSECNMTCHGNATETCGDSLRNLIFETGITKPIETRILGCFKDTLENRDLAELFFSKSVTTRHFCLSFCKKRNFKYAATQASNWCHCGDSYGRHGKVADSECNLKCSGDARETCGGDWRNLIFETGITEQIEMRILGCFKDIEGDRDLPETFFSDTSTTRQFCLIYCKGRNFKYAATQAGKWCHCADSYGRHGKVADSECNLNCHGNATETCGGSLRNLIFETGITKPLETRIIGCFQDVNYERDLPETFFGGTSTTRQFCLSYCKKKNFKYAATQASNWCHCGDSFGHHVKRPDSECNLKCRGDERETCGGSWRNLIFETGITKPIETRILGCFKDLFPDRDLGEYTFLSEVAITRHFCLTRCRHMNFKYAATQAGQWCHCGVSYGRHGKVADSECSTKCVGDERETCGGSWRNLIFETGI